MINHLEAFPKYLQYVIMTYTKDHWGSKKNVKLYPYSPDKIYE